MNRRFPDRHFTQPNIQFTRREIDVMIKVAEGLTTEDLAAELDIAESTAKRYLAQLFEKLNVRNRLALRTWALQHPQTMLRGWTPPGLKVHPRGCTCGGDYCRILGDALGFKKVA